MGEKFVDRLGQSLVDSIRDIPNYFEDRNYNKYVVPTIKRNIEMLLDEKYDEEKINELICKYYRLDDRDVDHMIADVKSARRRRNNGQR